MSNPKIYTHCSYIGETGFNYHSREFFRELSKHLNLKIRNFTIGKSWKGNSSNPHDGEFYLNETDKKILYRQTLWVDKNKRKDFKIYSGNDEGFDHDFNIILNETYHFYFFDDYIGPKIGYFVWESTEVPNLFFNKLKEFDEIWVPSKWQKNCLIHQGLEENKIQVVPEGVDSKIFYPDPDVKHSLTSDERFKFFLVGRWDYRKSTKEIIETFLKTFDKTEPVDLILSVDNPFSNDGFGTTEERLENYNLKDDRIKVQNFLSRQDYIDILKSCNVFLSCARSEGWNLPLIEAMASGTPSIYSQCSGQLEFANNKGLPVRISSELPVSANTYNHFNESVGNYYEPNFDDLSRVMRYTYQNYEGVKKGALIDSENIRKNFDWEVIGELGYQKCLEFYNKISSKEFSKNIPENEVIISYLDGPKVEIKGSKYKKYSVQFIDGDTNEIIHEDTINNNMWTSCGRKYFTNWIIKIDGEVVDRFDCFEKGVLISLESKAIGDTIAWTPYAVDFAKKHNCKVYLSTFHNNWFEGLEAYKDIEFISPGSSVNVYALFRVGWFRDGLGLWDKLDLYPNIQNTIPLQQTATDILGLPYYELNYGVNFKKQFRPINSKYIVFGPNATAGAKEWVYEHWVELSKKIREKGYQVVTLTQKPYYIEDTINVFGNSLDDVMNYLIYADNFIGLGSGLSWLNWALGKHTIMINGFSEDGHEFKSNVKRITNNICIKCWNDPVISFNPGDWDWCPVYKGTSKQHICQKSITPEQVYNALEL